MLPGVHGVVAVAVLKLALRLELGPEYDTNANRAEVVAGAPSSDVPTASPLLRTTMRGTLAWGRGVNLLRVGAGFGAKVFFNPDVYDQTTFVGQASVDERVRVDPRLDLGLGGDYYDATQLDAASPCSGCLRHRDFRSGTLLGRLTVRDQPGTLSLAGGYRGFEWKPDATFDFQAAQADVVATTPLRGPHDTEWELIASYHLERRWFAGSADRTCDPRKDPNCSCPVGAPLDYACLSNSEARADWFQQAALDLSFLGLLYAALGYAVQLNLSNSIGQSLLRHMLTLKLGYRIPWKIYATLKAQLFLTSYFDPVLLDRRLSSQTFITIEDENRNSVVVDLERPIGTSGVSIEARYSVYTNELSSIPVSFLRQVVYLGVSYRVGSR
jgi:hypothetical protein